MLPLPETITLTEIRVPFRSPLVTREATYTERRSIIVAVSAESHTGWGEAPAFPSGRWGTADDAWESLLDMAPDQLPAVPIAGAALQAARADLAARQAGVPLHALLKAKRRPVVARHTVGLGTDLTATLDQIGHAVDRGIRAIKVKVSPGVDVEPILSIRASFRDLDIAVDANTGYRDPLDPVFDALDHLGVSAIDQPFPADDLGAHAALRQRGLSMKVGLDESISSTAAAVTAIAAKAADVVSVKVNRMGLEAAKAVLASARTTGTGFKVGGTFDTSIGRRHLLAFATHSGVDDAEIGPPEGYLAADIATYPPLTDGTVTPDDAPGIGADPDPAAMAELTLRTTVIP